MSLTRDYDYQLPPDLIARRPLARREDSRMMLLHRNDHRIEHRMFSDFPQFLRDGDLVILNDTKVIPARAFSDDRRVEFLFLEQLDANSWKCLVRPGRRLRFGEKTSVGNVEGRVTAALPNGERVIEFTAPLPLGEIGEMPIPHYLKREPDAGDTERYQTVFARAAGAVAAPTAGLHFTSKLLAKIPHAFVTLHVGAGTFRPVKAEQLSAHQMHSEKFEISAETAASIHRAQRIVAVGTTTVRVLESSIRMGRKIAPQQSETDIFIYPPFDFQIVSTLLTNFHLPRSTLLMLVCAFAGREFVLEAYAEAVKEKYRFYSYGDCMLVL